jgi:basic membrane protein A
MPYSTKEYVMQRKGLLTVILLLCLAVLGGAVNAQDMMRVAVILPSATTDLAWSQSMYESLLRVQEAAGGEGALEIAYTEGMYDVTAATQAMRDYAEDGYQLVIGHGSQYFSSILEIANDYPETSFAYSTSADVEAAEAPPNVFSYDVRAQEGGYVNGVMAGLLTESNTIGIVGPIAAGDAILYINGFQQGVHAANPDANIIIAYTESFADTAKAAEIAQSQLAAGADVLTGTAQQVPGAIDAVQAAGAYWMGSELDKAELWPEAVPASTIYDWSSAVQGMLDARASGMMGGSDFEITMAQGGYQVVYNEAIDVPAEVFEAGRTAEAAIKAGTVYPLSALPTETYRVALIMPSAITDLAWSQSMYDGLVRMQAQLGGEDALEIAYTEGMFDVTAAAQAMRDYAEDGYDLVIAHGTQYGTSLFELAADYPETAFAWGTATDVGAEQGLTNVFAYEARAEQGGYINGVMAGLLTESGTVGIVGPVAAGDALLYINGFQQGVMAANPDAEILLAYTESFGDTAKAAEVAQTQIGAGADVLTGSAQQVVGAIDAIEAAGGYWFGTQSDQSGSWPETVVASQVFNWTPVVGRMIEHTLYNRLGGQAYELSLTNGGLEIIYGGVDVPEDVRAAADAAIASIQAGEITVSPDMPE